MKILQYIGAIDLLDGAGGAKRVFCSMANALAARGHEVYAVCHTARSGYPFVPLDDRIHFISNGLGCRKRIIKLTTWVKGIRPFFPSTWNEMIKQHEENRIFKRKGEPLIKLIREIQPDIVIPYFVNDYFSMLRQPMLNVPVILMHHMNAAEFLNFVNTKEKTAKINTCPHLQVLQRSFIPEIQKIYHGSIHVIPNEVPQITEKELADLTVEKPQKTIAMISRIDPGKQQHLLLQAFERLAKDYSEWNVEIYGQSVHQYSRQLESMLVSLGLTGRVKLMGATDHPLEVLRKVDVFAFPSLSEGFPLALTEAMAVGLPCVGLKTTPSVNELIVDGVNGFLADNTPEDFAAKLKALMDDRNCRVKLGGSGHEMMKRYAPETIWNQWEQLIGQVVRQHRQRKAA